MAEEKLHTTAADDAAKTSDTSNDDIYGVPMDEVEAVLNATADKEALSPQIQQMMQRQAENRRRVEESIKGTKANAAWFVPLFCTLMIVGLIWAVVYYLNPALPIPGIGVWNLVIGLTVIFVGFIMTMWWR
ncbi:septation inhibitor protein [Gardnerella vaginalis]|uniref:Cell division protein CrgA n=1 Tax=Gardnerella vaginalis TaxID=2702 RepID=A0A3E1IZK8_GARVA|nr:MULTISPECIES: cell division protein CrgA [Gardnerella]RFD78455.1 septation inhibitor protein [Gardnerella vaginalis]